MKSVLLTVMLLYSISWSQVYMNIKMKDGTTARYTLEEVRKLTFNGTVGVKEGEVLSKALSSFTLLQNYPNPFNPSTTIEYKIIERGNVDVKIYSITGELVTTLKNNIQNPGSYKIIWNGDNSYGEKVSSGIYFLQVKHNAELLTKKLMLIK